MKDGTAPSRAVAVSLEKMEWKRDRSEADAPVFGQWPLLALHEGDGHFVSVAPQRMQLQSACRVSARMPKYLQGMWLRKMVKIRTANLREFLQI